MSFCFTISSATNAGTVKSWFMLKWWNDDFCSFLRMFHGFAICFYKFCILIRMFSAKKQVPSILHFIIIDTLVLVEEKFGNYTVNFLWILISDTHSDHKNRITACCSSLIQMSSQFTFSGFVWVGRFNSFAIGKFHPSQDYRFCCIFTIHNNLVYLQLNLSYTCGLESKTQ